MDDDEVVRYSKKLMLLILVPFYGHTRYLLTMIRIVFRTQQVIAYDKNQNQWHHDPNQP